MEDDELVAIDLTAEERFILRRGLVEWGGPAHCTDEMAVAMGFEGLFDLLETTERLHDSIEGARPMTRFDWARTLLATEIVFVSNLVGAGHDWSICTGVSDEETLIAIRRIQRKMPAAVYRTGIGTRPSAAAMEQWRDSRRAL